MLLYGLLLALHVLVSIALVVAVLLQSSKGGGLAGTFGGAGMTGGVFGGRGAAPLLAKATTVFAVMFMLTSVTLNLVKTRGQEGSSLQQLLQESQGLSTPAVTTEMPVVTESEEAVDTTDAEASDQPADAPEPVRKSGIVFVD